jgi:hypothetical protein
LCAVLVLLVLLLLLLLLLLGHCAYVMFGKHCAL